MTHSDGAREEAGLRARLDALCADGWAVYEEFERTVRARDAHPFVAADYDLVRTALLPLRTPGLRFLEWGSASGVITVMADLMGFDACGIELDASPAASSRPDTDGAGMGTRAPSARARRDTCNLGAHWTNSTSCSGIRGPVRRQ